MWQSFWQFQEKEVILNSVKSITWNYIEEKDGRKIRKSSKYCRFLICYSGFISYKCKRDHINSQFLASITKSTSQYKTQYRRDNTISPFEEKSKMIGKTRNSPVKKVPTSIVTPLSQYNHSYHNQSPVKKPTLHHEGPTFFLKQQKID